MASSTIAGRKGASSVMVDEQVVDNNRTAPYLNDLDLTPLIRGYREKDEKLMALRRGIQGFKKDEDELKRGIRECREKVFGLMFVKGESDEILKSKRFEFDALKDLSDQAMEMERDLASLQLDLLLLISEKNETPLRFQKLKTLVNGVDCSNINGEMWKLKIKDSNGRCMVEGGERQARQLSEEIELLDLMLAKATVALLDLKIVAEEIEALKGSEEGVAKVLEAKTVELQDDLWELKRAIVELKGKKKSELMERLGFEEDEKKLVTGVEKGTKGVEAVKLNWPDIAVSVGAVAVAAALVLIGCLKTKVSVKRENKQQRG